MTRIWLGFLLALSCVFVIPTNDADARKQNKRATYNQYRSYQPGPPPLRLYQPPPYSQYQGYQGGSPSGSSDCPGAGGAHDYDAYPCWAQRAFAPKGGGR